jgi:hypothetical protein
MRTPHYGDSRLPEKFWAKVELIPFSSCWYWTGSTGRDGRGRYAVKGGERRWSIRLAYRVAYTWLVRPIPSGLEMDHYFCNDPGCVNPSHVRPVTHRENCLRGNSPIAYQMARTHCPQGHLLVPGNLVRIPELLGDRKCKTCNNARSRATHERKRTEREMMKLLAPEQAWNTPQR